MDESAGAVAGSKRTRSVKSDGIVMKNEAQPEELLAILADHLKRINAAGIPVEMIPNVTRTGRKCVGFLVMGVEIISGRMVVLPENKALPENQALPEK